MLTQETKTEYEWGGKWPDVSVVIPLYNYEKYIVETLECVRDQTIEEIGLVVLDDCSKDESLRTARDWAEDNASRFMSIRIARNIANAGLSITRNTGVGIAKSPYLFFLDADNHIYPRCLQQLYAALCNGSAVFSYSILEIFGSETGIMGTEVFDRERFVRGNYIDAMAMVRRDKLVEYGGYRDMKYGWEDYELWLRICEGGEYGVQVPEVLGRYRVHPESMIRTVTSAEKNYPELRKQMKKLHPWLEI